MVLRNQSKYVTDTNMIMWATSYMEVYSNRQKKARRNHWSHSKRRRDGQEAEEADRWRLNLEEDHLGESVLKNDEGAAFGVHDETEAIDRR